MTRQKLRVGFVMEHALGHIAHAQLLEAAVAEDEGIAADWMRIPYSADDMFEKFPRLPFSLKLSLRARRRIRERLRREPLDCLFMHTQALSPACLALISSIPSVISLDATPRDFGSIAPAYGARAATGPRGMLKTALFRQIFAKARGLVTMSTWARDSLQRDYGVDTRKVAVVQPGVDLAAWIPGDRQARAGDRLRLLFVGGDFERKGGATVLEAFRNGLSEVCELDIVTRDERLVDAPGIRVHRGLTPNAPALRRLFAEADLFVLPSQGDASPFALLEAMACGIPVVATDVGAIGEMVENGVNGHLIAPNDPKVLAECVRALARDRARLATMGNAARRTTELRFDASRNYPRIVAFLKEVACAPA